MDAEGNGAGLPGAGDVFPIHVQVAATPKSPALDHRVGRVTVLLGSNGSGKTSLLGAILDEWKATDKPAGKPRPRPPRADFDVKRRIRHFGVERFDDLPRKIDPVTRMSPDRPEPMGEDRLKVLIGSCFSGFPSDKEYALEIGQWYLRGQAGPPPVREMSFNTLPERVQQMLPHLTLTVAKVQDDRRGFPLQVQREGMTYPAALTSAGEKRILFWLAELFVGAADGDVFLVDEPELHLHPALADKFWATVEQTYGSSIFIYATHSLAFAMRDGVDTCIALAGPGKPPLPFDRPAEGGLLSGLPFEQQRELLGAIPGILRAERALATEGLPDSIDAAFYPWVLGDPEAVVVPMGGSNSVRSAMKFTGPLEALAGRARVVGVVDRDFLVGAEDGPHVVLPLREAESYLCLPKLLHDLATKLAAVGVVERPPTESEFQDSLAAYCERLVRHVASQRAIRRVHRDEAFGAKTKDFTGLDDEAVVAKLKEGAERHLERARSLPADVESAVRSELALCRQAVQDRDPLRLLELFPCKAYLADVAKRLGVARPSKLFSTVKACLHADDYPHVLALRKLLAAKWYGGA